MHVRPMGPLAFVVECDGASPADVADQIRAVGGRGVVDAVPAAQTVLVDCLDEPTAVLLAETVRSMRSTGSTRSTAAAPSPSVTVEIPVRFDGDDLAEVAERVGRPRDEVIATITAASYEVAFCGFAPGFAYLTGLDPSLHLPRRGRPRTRVPAGSLAIAAGYAAVYPAESPGGWHLLGRTETEVWSIDRRPPALLTPGTPVRFTAVTDG